MKDVEKLHMGLSENREYPQKGNFNGEHGDNPLEFEIHYVQTNPHVFPFKLQFWGKNRYALLTNRSPDTPWW